MLALDQYLEVNGCSSVDGLEGQYHHLESYAGCNRKPVEVTEEGVHMGEFGQIENKAHCRFLDILHQFSLRGWESSQKRVTVVKVRDDQWLD